MPDCRVLAHGSSPCGSPLPPQAQTQLLPLPTFHSNSIGAEIGCRKRKRHSKEITHQRELSNRSANPCVSIVRFDRAPSPCALRALGTHAAKPPPAPANARANEASCADRSAEAIEMIEEFAYLTGIGSRQVGAGDVSPDRRRARSQTAGLSLVVSWRSRSPRTSRWGCRDRLGCRGRPDLRCPRRS